MKRWRAVVVGVWSVFIRRVVVWSDAAMMLSPDYSDIVVRYGS